MQSTMSRLAQRSVAIAAVLTMANSITPQNAQAACGGQWFGVWPDEGVLPANGRIIVFGPADGLEMAKNGQEFKPFLQSASDTVALEVSAFNRGGFNTAEVVLVPAGALQPGATYLLYLDANSPLRTYYRGELLPVTFRIEGPDRAGPVWTGRPKVGAQETIAFGCGPSSWTNVNVPYADDTDVLFFVELTRIDGEEPVQRAHIGPSTTHQIRIGHGMCGGSFDPASGAKYQARITAVDAAGNRAPAPSEVTFVAPKKGGR